MKSTGVVVSGRGNIVLPAKLRKEMKIEAGTKILVTREDDRIILQPVQSFTDKLAGITKKSFGGTPETVTRTINDEREDR